MAAGIWFWIIFVLVILFGFGMFWVSWPYTYIGFPVILLVLIGLLGWKVFGPPIQ